MDGIDAALPEPPLAYRHAGVLERLRERHALAPETADSLFEDLLLFLWAGARSPTEMIPSASVDDAWHTFLLYTQDYAAFCRTWLGRFVHHEPYDPPADLDLSTLAADRSEVAARSRSAGAHLVADRRPAHWPHHRAALLFDHIAASPVVQEIVVTLIEEPDSRKRFLESPRGWLGERRANLSDAAYLSVYDFFGGALRFAPAWAGVTDRVRAFALSQLMTPQPRT